MPLTTGALRKMRADARKALVNDRVRKNTRSAVSGARKKPTADTINKAFSALDRAAKSKTIHKNKANRLKSRLAKLLK